MYRYMYSGQFEFLFRSPPRPRAHHTASKLGRVGCCIPYLLMNIAATNPATNPIVRIRNCDTPGAYLHVHVKQSSRTRLSQPVSYVAPPRAQHTHIAVGGLEYLISLMSS
jgi:hypothetical protein